MPHGVTVLQHIQLYFRELIQSKYSARKVGIRARTHDQLCYLTFSREADKPLEVEVTRDELVWLASMIPVALAKLAELETTTAEKITL